jgi:uncharacterized peroxidase-related enzyme
MPWIEVVPPDEADGELAAAYEVIRKRRGKLSNIMAIQGLNPKMIGPHLDLYMAIMFERSGLTRGEREMVAVRVSVLNGCEYCTRHHAEALRACWRADERADALERGEIPEWLSDREREMLSYAERLTEDPSGVEEKDVLRLREVGLSDPEIVNLASVVGYFNFVNRIAEGLGVEVTDEEVAGYRY